MPLTSHISPSPPSKQASKHQLENPPQQTSTAQLSPKASTYLTRASHVYNRVRKLYLCCKLTISQDLLRDTPKERPPRFSAHKNTRSAHTSPAEKASHTAGAKNTAMSTSKESSRASRKSRIASPNSQPLYTHRSEALERQNSPIERTYSPELSVGSSSPVLKHPIISIPQQPMKTKVCV